MHKFRPINMTNISLRVYAGGVGCMHLIFAYVCLHLTAPYIAYIACRGIARAHWPVRASHPFILYGIGWCNEIDGQFPSEPRIECPAPASPSASQPASPSATLPLCLEWMTWLLPQRRFRCASVCAISHREQTPATLTLRALTSAPQTWRLEYPPDQRDRRCATLIKWVEFAKCWV